MPGAKRLCQDGRGLALTSRSAGGSLRATLGRGLEHGRPFGVGAWKAERRETVGRVRVPERSALAHLRALVALDAKGAGASDLEIAAMFTAPAILAQSWSPDSAARALVRDAIKRGRMFRDRRWPDLIWPGRRAR
jgi:hypothetical protein